MVFSWDPHMVHKICKKVCKLYFKIQEQYQDEFEEMGELFDGDWIRMTEYATGDYEEIDSDDNYHEHFNLKDIFYHLKCEAMHLK